MASPLISANCCCNAVGNGGISRSSGLFIEGEDCAFENIVRKGAKGLKRSRNTFLRGGVGVPGVPLETVDLETALDFDIANGRCWRMERRFVFVSSHLCERHLSYTRPAALT